MSEANSVPVPSDPIGRYPGHAPAAAAKSKLLDRFHEALRSRRRSFATHQLEGDYETQLVQEILGHEGAKATMLYIHVLNCGGMDKGRHECRERGEADHRYQQCRTSAMAKLS
jgi:hypothetical protein